MKKIFYNEDNLNEKDINNSVKRAKLLIINSNNEILLGYGHNTYQIIGDHIEDNELHDEYGENIKILDLLDKSIVDKIANKNTKDYLFGKVKERKLIK